MKPFLILFALILALSGCGAERGVPQTLVVVTRNAPTTWYEGRDGSAEGPEHDLVRSFARAQQVDFRFEVVDSIGEVLARVQSGEAHMAAAGLSVTDKRKAQGLHFAPSYSDVQQQVVCRRQSGKLPRKVADLVGRRLAVIADSSYAERLEKLKADHPQLAWSEVDDADTEQLLERVWRKKIDCTVADSNIVRINRRYYPELVVAFDLGEAEQLAWVLAPGWDHLDDHVEKWLAQARKSGALARIDDRYYGHVEQFDYVDMRRFTDRIPARLKKYQDEFKKAAARHGFDWLLLAAQAYQESHWNPAARSRTGVRGMMMLTQATARQMGVKSRLNAAQSIHGGARYLKRMLERLPQSVAESDRLWYALAAYNIGFGHLEDAMTLARKLKRNPDQWLELREVLPLLREKKHYRSLRHGYARGDEPVLYVNRIRDYHQVLLRHYAARKK